jgi:hypothetical protein
MMSVKYVPDFKTKVAKPGEYLPFPKNVIIMTL